MVGKGIENPQVIVDGLRTRTMCTAWWVNLKVREAWVLKMGVCESHLVLILGKGQMPKLVKWTRWFLRKEMKLNPPFDDCPTTVHHLIMKIIIWNSRGTLKPNFQIYIRDLVQNHDPAIMVIMETKLSGVKAKVITNRLPFDGAIHTKTIGYAGGLWLLWNSDRVEVKALANTEQEIHVEVKVRPSNFTWILFAIYASPKCEERRILWENLTKVADLHNMPWIMASDFNEPLIEEDKYGGRGVHVNCSPAFKDCLDYCNMVDMGFSGPRYTWTNKRELNNLILERIDRFFMNPD